jgi:anthranilate synthase/aminodeoxychorismate synthase-like glutamine amidotransferase
MVDNYDSFTYNLVQALAHLGASVTVRYNDEVAVADLVRLGATHLVVSPGPGRPERAGASLRMIEAATGELPVLGVCLGHQAIAIVFGGVVGAATSLMHGKPSPIAHDSKTIFADLPSPFLAGRYHSLAVERASLPAELEVSAVTTGGEIMAIRHSSFAVEGVQFHPESILTPDGDRLLANFLALDNLVSAPRQPLEVAS